MLSIVYQSFLRERIAIESKKEILNKKSNEMRHQQYNTFFSVDFKMQFTRHKANNRVQLEPSSCSSHISFRADVRIEQQTEKTPSFEFNDELL